jgi:nucleoprotein TPR
LVDSTNITPSFSSAETILLENARVALDSELRELKSSSSSSTSEVQTLQSRLAVLEASNRDTVALLDSKSGAHDRLAEELSTQQQKIIGLRREVSELEEKLQRAENSSMSTKFREQNLQQEVDLLKKSNEWHEDELKRRTAEHTKFRKEKGARIAELQRSNEDATQSVEALRRTETTLRNRLEEVNQKAGDAFTRVQALEDDAAKAQETFRVELDSAHRLAELQKQSANTARARLQDVQGAYDQLKDDAAEEIGHLQAEAESERAEKELLEHKTSELEVQLEHREAEIAAARHTTSVPGTPRRGINGTNGTPGLVGSPGVFASPGGSRLKSGLSVTQLYSEHSQLRADLDKERRRSERLKSTLDEMIRDLEQKQPEIEELRTEHDRLQADVEELSSLLEEANKSREDARKETRKVEGHAAGLAQEGELLRQQLRDLSSQIKVLLLEAQAREEGLESLSPADQVQFELAARGELDDSNIDGVSDTGRLISRRLIIFRNAHELQEQNVKLLHLTRKLGEEMEGDEAKAKRVQEDKDKQDLEELRERVERHQDEMKSLILRSESYIRERDMFRRMLANRGQLPAGADPTAIFGQSINSSAFGASTGLQAGDASQDSRDLDDHRKLLKEMQSHFDAYRQEASTDHSALKEQMDRVSKEKVDLQGEIARTSSQLALARERYDLLQANMNMLKGENSELQKRSSYLAEVAAKQDLRTQHVAEDLVEVKSMADGLRNENANLKAERELWKNIESRLSEDNRQLMDERSRLNKMMSDLQSLQNERELTESETRRRLQSRAESLESELQSAKRKLDEEVEESKKAAMRREYDQDQNRTRVDDLLKGLSNTREDLVAAKTSRDILQARVEEMKIDLRNAEERAQAMQPRPTPRSTTTAPVNAGLTDQENQLTAEQELAVQAADLKRDLELARNELQQASEHVDQYKAISQSAEEELQSMNEIHDQYKNETDTLLSQRDARIQDLETRVEEISSELATTNTELSEVHARLEDTASQFAEQRAILNSEIVRLRDDSERFNETSKLHQADLKAQAEIAQRAQQSYEDELVKHAEAAKLLQKVRSEFNVVKTEVAGYKAEADAAKMTVQQNEESWAESRNRYEQELTELRNRREDVNSQNRRLHQQLETISAQIVTLKQSRSTFGQGEEQEITSFGPESNREEIITWLKNEKEIVEVQLELSAQEAKRYKQKLDHTETLLDETREKLNQERQSQTDRDQTTMSHNSLMESLSQLNLFRESNASLRNEARQAQSQLAERTKEVAELTSQLEPLRTRAREVENELENKEGEIKLLQEDRDRWQKRTQDILQKYDRVDPAELEALKTQITTLQTERDQLVLEKTTMQVQIDGVSDQIKQATDEVERVLGERRQKIVDQSKEKARKDKVIIQEKTQLLDAATVDNARVQSELVAVRDELQRTTAARDEALANRKSNTEEDEEGQINDVSQVSSETAALQSRILAADARASEEKARSATLEIENQSLQGRVQELQIQVVSDSHRFNIMVADIA